MAEYILSEIRTNVRSETAETIRYLIDDETTKQRRAEWNKLPFYAKLAPYPQPDLLAAMGVRYEKEGDVVVLLCCLPDIHGGLCCSAKTCCDNYK